MGKVIANKRWVCVSINIKNYLLYYKKRTDFKVGFLVNFLHLLEIPANTKCHSCQLVGLLTG